MTENNLRHWNKLANVPKDMLKSFTKGGGFKGTDIKPQWRFLRMTEVFGPCGKGWGMNEPNFRVEGSNVFCVIGVGWRDSDGEQSMPVWGVGGEALTGRGDDEAFKKAYTDALGNALVKVGVASDIYMGFFDGSKYTKQTVDEDAPEGERGVVERKSAYAERKTGHFERIINGLKLIEEQGSLDDLKAFWQGNFAHLEEMPEGWQAELTERKDELKKAFLDGANKPLDGARP